MHPQHGPQRIVCLTEETTEWLYLLGEQERIVGISGYTVRPRQARQEKPRVSAFLDGKIDKIVALEPDLVIGFSDMQAALADKLIRAGLEVWITNQRSVAQIFTTLRRVAALVGADDRAEAWIAGVQARHAQIAGVAAVWPRRPRVYFEEWDMPMISAIRWVSELVALAGGEDLLGEGDDALVVLGLEHQEQKLVATSSADGVSGPNDRSQPLRHRRQHPVADVVPVRVVDDLEVVEIDEEDGEPPLVA
jgi:ABC-type Fe3+-hydroxamate transport system substrate-binding protein